MARMMLVTSSGPTCLWKPSSTSMPGQAASASQVSLAKQRPDQHLASQPLPVCKHVSTSFFVELWDPTYGTHHMFGFRWVQTVSGCCRIWRVTDTVRTWTCAVKRPWASLSRQTYTVRGVRGVKGERSLLRCIRSRCRTLTISRGEGPRASKRKHPEVSRFIVFWHFRCSTAVWLPRHRQHISFQLRVAPFCFCLQPHFRSLKVPKWPEAPHETQ